MIMLSDTADKITATPDHIVAKVRVVEDRMIKVYTIGLDGIEKPELEAAVQTMEDEYGDVLSIHRVSDDSELYRAAFEFWDVVGIEA